LVNAKQENFPSPLAKVAKLIGGGRVEQQAESLSSTAPARLG
jgi:hypothetical protein